MAPPRLAEGREHLAATSDGCAARCTSSVAADGGLDGNMATVEVIVVAATAAPLGELPTPTRWCRRVLVACLAGCLLGGWSRPVARTHRSNASTRTLTRRLPNLGEARHGLGAAVVDGVAYALLGGASRACS